MRTTTVQPSGSTATVINLMSIARIFNIKITQVSNLAVGVAVDAINVLFDASTETVWENTGATGNVVSWTITGSTLSLVTSKGTFTLKGTLGETTSIQWVYNSGKATGGETTVTVDSLGTMTVSEVYVNGIRQFKDQGFTVAGSVITLAGALKANDLVVVILNTDRDVDDSYASLFSGTSGAGQIGTENGGTVQDYIDYVVLTAYGQPVGTDYTTLFTKAYATGRAVYVPEGTYFTSLFKPKQTFGPGLVFSDFKSDGLFADSGQRIINPFNNFNSNPIYLYTSSTGNYERGAGLSVLFNMEDSRPQIMGFNTDSTQGTYTNRDAVGLYIGSRGPSDQPVATNCTFTTSTFSSSDITNDFLSEVKVGMFCVTLTGSYGARIISVDEGTITVSGWYSPGNTNSGQVPTNGSSVRINDVSKIWGQNTLLFIDETKSGASTGTGYELGFQLSSQPSLLWGFDSVNYSDTFTGDRAHLARGLWGVGFYSAGSVKNGFMHELSTLTNNNVGVLIQNLLNPNFTGSVLKLNTNFRNDNSKLLDITSGGVSNWFVTTAGNRSSIRELYQLISSSTTLNKLNNSTLLCTNNSAITLTIDGSSVPVSMQFEISALGSGGVTLKTTTGTSVKTLSSGQSIKVTFDGNNFNVLYFSDNREIGINTITAATNTISSSTLKRTRFVGNVDSQITFDMTNMTDGQEFEIMNHSTSNTLTVSFGSSSKAISSGGYARFLFAGSAIFQVS